MARAKKEAALTPEERLQAALVPDWEWPYKLPKNWCWTRIGMVSNFERGITFPAAAKEAAPTEDNIPCLRTANVQENLEIDDMIYVNRDFMKGNIAKLVRENDIIMSSANSRELVGKSSLVTHIPFPMTFGGFVLNIRAKEMSSKYLFYFLRHEFLAGKFIGESSQTTNIANINTTTLGNYEIPLPPLPEQQRIVDRIESLFAKLDEAKEKAQAVVDSFEARKAAILHKAFTGELTAKWREEHGVRMESWEKHLLSTVSSLQTGLMKGKKYTGKTVELPYLRVANVQDGFLRLDEIKKIDVEENAISRYSLAVGDVLFTEGGDFDKLGRGTVWEGQTAVVWRDWKYKVGDHILFNDTDRFSLLYNNLKGRIVQIELFDSRIRFTVDVEIPLTEQDCQNDGIEFIDIIDDVTRIRFDVLDFEEEMADEDRKKAIVPFQLAYAVSIHKAQGLEYRSVKVVIPSSNAEKITHGIFYTAITRAKEKLKIYWSSETMQEVVAGFSVDTSKQKSLAIIKEKLKQDKNT